LESKLNDLNKKETPKKDDNKDNNSEWSTAKKLMIFVGIPALALVLIGAVYYFMKSKETDEE